MALTLTEGNKYSRTELQAAVIDRLVKDSRILEVLPFATILGNSLTYDTIVSDSTASFFSVGDTWTESTPSLSQTVVTLKILGGDADLDNFLLKTRSNIIDLKGTVIGNKVRSVQYTFLDTFYYGSAAADSKTFDGLHTLIANTTYNTVHAGATGGTALSMAKVRQAIDLITGWKPNLIVMSKGMRRDITKYLDSIGDKFYVSRDAFGRHIQTFDGIEISVDDHIVDTETASTGAYSAKTGSDNSTIFILSFNEQACCGVHSGEGVQVEPLGTLETKDATRWRIKWYCGMMFQDLRSCAKVDGATIGSTVTA